MLTEICHCYVEGVPETGDGAKGGSRLQQPNTWLLQCHGNPLWYIRSLGFLPALKRELDSKGVELVFAYPKTQAIIPVGPTEEGLDRIP